MDEQMEKVIALAGNEHKYQYFTLAVVIFLWINCNFISCVLTFLEREPIISYTDSSGVFHDDVILSSDICPDLEKVNMNYTKKETFDYSWVNEYHLECKNFDVANIGSFAMAGNAAGGFVFSFISKFLSHKKILIISSFCFCLAAFLCTLVTSYDYFYALLASELCIGLFGNCLCYSSLVVAQETVSDRKRAMFNSIINVGYAFCGIIYALLFMGFKDWRTVFYILIGASLFTMILIWVFVYDSPRGYMNDKNYEKVMQILEGIASFNGKLDDFRESIKQDEYQDILSMIKGEQPIPIMSERSSNYDTIKKKEEDQENKEDKEKNDENEIEFNGEITEGKIQNLTTSLINDQNKENNVDIKEKTINIWSLFKYPSIRYKFLLLDFLWIGTRGTFNGITIASKSFSGNFYVNMVVLYILESFSYFVSGFLIDIKKIGRRGTLWIEYAVLFLMFMLLAFLDLDTGGSLTLNYISRFCAAGIEVIYYSYSIEIYPTPVRSVAFGINATFGNVGSIFAPQLIEHLLTWQYLILFDVITAINAVVLICLPETVGKPMVETIKELEEGFNININGEVKGEQDTKLVRDSEVSNLELKVEDNLEVKDNDKKDKKEEKKEENNEEKKEENEEEKKEENEEEKKEENEEEKKEENKDVINNEEKKDAEVEEKKDENN